jgi:tetratricopeptide (TPR) repeat protein
VSELLREQQVTPAYGILLELFSKFPGYAPELGQLATIAHSLGYNNLEFMVLKQLYTDYTITPDYVKSYYSMHLLLSYFSALADMSISFGNYTIAESVCNTLIQFEPDVWDHKFILAQVYFQEKRYAPAMNICCDIIRIAPSQCYPYILAAQIYEAQGNKVKAIAVLNQCIDNNADDPATHSAAAQLSRLLAGKKTGQ